MYCCVAGDSVFVPILNVPFILSCMFYFLCIFKSSAGVDKSLAWVPEASRFSVQQGVNIPLTDTRQYFQNQEYEGKQ